MAGDKSYKATAMVTSNVFEATAMPSEIFFMNGGSSGSGTTDYNSLDNKPSINGVTLEGDVSLSDLGFGAAPLDVVDRIFDGEEDAGTDEEGGDTDD